MTTSVTEVLWAHIRPVLADFADRLTTVDSTVMPNIQRTANGSFPLRCYLALKRTKDGEEMAITVDVRSNKQQLIVESDVCIDNGEVIAAGPSTIIVLAEDQSLIDSAICGWTRDFEQFLRANETTIFESASSLK